MSTTQDSNIEHDVEQRLLSGAPPAYDEVVSTPPPYIPNDSRGIVNRALDLYGDVPDVLVHEVRERDSLSRNSSTIPTTHNSNRSVIAQTGIINYGPPRTIPLSQRQSQRISRYEHRNGLQPNVASDNENTRATIWCFILMLKIFCIILVLLYYAQRQGYRVF